MTEQERNVSRPESDRADAEAARPGSGPPAANEDEVTPADQAIVNQERALESGEENAV